MLEPANLRVGFFLQRSPTAHSGELVPGQCVVALLVAVATAIGACKPKAMTVPHSGPTTTPAVAPAFYQAREQAFAQVAHAELTHPDDPNATSDTPEPEAVLSARAESASIQGINEAMNEADVQAESMNLIGLPLESCKNTLKQWAESSDDTLVGHACVATFIGTFALTFYGALKLSRFVTQLPMGTHLNGFLKSIVRDPINNLTVRVREFFAANKLPFLARSQALQIAESIKPTYLSASAAVSLTNQKWAANMLSAVGNDTEKLLQTGLTLQAKVQTQSRLLEQLVSKGAPSDEIAKALTEVRETQVKFIANRTLVTEARQNLLEKLHATTITGEEKKLQELLYSYNVHNDVFHEQVRLQRRLASLSSDATALQKLRTLLPNPEIERDIETIDKRMKSQAQEAVEIKNRVQKTSQNARRIGSDESSKVIGTENYDDILNSIDDLSAQIPDDPDTLVKAAVTHAADVSKGVPPGTTPTVFGAVTRDTMTNGTRFGKALALGNGLLTSVDVVEVGFRGLSAADSLQEQRPGKAALTMAFAAIPFACGAVAGAVSFGTMAVPSALACSLAVATVGGVGEHFAGKELDKRWEAKLDRQGSFNELALLGEYRSSNADTEACLAITAQADLILANAVNANATGKRAMSEEELKKIAAGEQEAPKSQVGWKPEAYDQSRYLCAKGQEGARSFVAGEKVLVRRSDLNNRSVAAIKAMFANTPQGPYIVSKSKLCESVVFEPDVQVKKNTTASTTLTTDKETLSTEQKERGRCTIKISEDAGFHLRNNCQKFAAEMSLKNGGDYQCQRCTTYCCCKHMFQRILENQMKVACEHQLGTWKAY